MWSLMAFAGLLVILLGVIAVIRPMPSVKLPTRGRGLAVLVGFVMLSVGAVQDQAAKGPAAALDGGVADDQRSAEVAPGDAPPAATTTAQPTASRGPAWMQIANWQGSGMKETESFVVASREWRIRWKSGNEPFANAGILQLFVHNERGQLVSLAANQQGPGEDVSYVRAPPGRYYLKINSANIDWDISIEDQR